MSNISQAEKTSGITLNRYVFGFVLSLALTLAGFLLVEIHASTGHFVYSRVFLIATIALLAIAQFLVQLFYFLHLGNETRPRWKLFVLIFMLLIVGILVGGSLWIMYNLNYRMTPQQINTYMQQQDGGF